MALKPLTFYTYPLAFHPAKAAMMLAEKRLPHRTIRVDLLGPSSLNPDFLKLNPGGLLPMLIVDGKVVVESKVICKLLDSMDGQPLGGDKVDRAFVEKFVDDIDEFDGNLWAYSCQSPGTLALMKSMEDFKKKVAEKRAKQYPDMADIYNGRIKTMGKLMDMASNDPSKVQECKAVLARLLDTAETRLTRPSVATAPTAEELFLGGLAFSIADAMFAPILFRVWMLGKYQELIAPRPVIADYMKRLRTRESWQAAFGEATSTWGKLSNIVPTLLSVKIRSLLHWY